MVWCDRAAAGTEMFDSHTGISCERQSGNCNARVADKIRLQSLKAITITAGHRRPGWRPEKTAIRQSLVSIQLYFARPSQNQAASSHNTSVIGVSTVMRFPSIWPRR
jgi:hypothetical protein